MGPQCGIQFLGVSKNQVKHRKVVVEEKVVILEESTLQRDRASPSEWLKGSECQVILDFILFS